MRKKHTRFQQVPLATIEKLLQVQEPLAKPNGHRKPVAKKRGKAASGAQRVPKRVEVLTS